MGKNLNTDMKNVFFLFVFGMQKKRQQIQKDRYRETEEKQNKCTNSSFAKKVRNRCRAKCDERAQDLQVKDSSESKRIKIGTRKR